MQHKNIWILSMSILCSFNQTCGMEQLSSRELVNQEKETKLFAVNQFDLAKQDTILRAGIN